MPEIEGLGWSIDSRTAAQMRDELSVMVSRCMKKYGKPPLTVYAGVDAFYWLAEVKPQSVKVESCINFHPRMCLLSVQE